MGLTIEVNTLEEMCALMCDNEIPKNKKMTTQITMSEYLDNKQSEINKKRFQEINPSCCRDELYEFMLAMNKRVCVEFVTLGNCHYCSNYDTCIYMHDYTLGQLEAMAFGNYK